MVGTELKVMEFSTLGMPISKQRIPDKSNDERPGGSRERDEKKRWKQ